MLKTTLSAAAAVVIGMSGLSAEIADKSVNVSIDANESNTKVVTKVDNDKANDKDIKVVASPSVPTSESTTKPSVIVTTVVQEEAPAESTPTVEDYEDTIVYTKGVKNNYDIGEEIKIKLTLKRDAYIYFWTVSYDGKGYLILPNDFNVVTKYEANKDHLIPEATADYQFASDRAGVEEVFVLATSKPISVNEIKGIFSEKSSGGVVPTATKDSMANFVSKDLVVIAKKEKLQYDIASFQIGIHDPKADNAAQSAQSDTGASTPSVNIIINKQ
ncbi:MAG TPA: DUF4384 domain-containing protein [Epsilonproteobacteria bacterium]|nr:DUF4384 domain-containing protein [Campylobacterota bacterium]